MPRSAFFSFGASPSANPVSDRKEEHMYEGEPPLGAGTEPNSRAERGSAGGLVITLALAAVAGLLAFCSTAASASQRSVHPAHSGHRLLDSRSRGSCALQQLRGTSRRATCLRPYSASSP